MTLHSALNERLELVVSHDLVGEFRPELAAFLDSHQIGGLLESVFLPLARTTTRTAVAYEERPWPPTGIGARAIRGMSLAVVLGDTRVLLTPTYLSPAQATNVGLGAALTKTLLEELVDTGVDSVSYFVHQGSGVVAGELVDVGFEPHTARMVTAESEFVAMSADPRDVLGALGLNDISVGDTLDLALDRERVRRLTSFHLALAAALEQHWAGHGRWAEVFPGYVEWDDSLPPGGTAGRRVVVDE